MPACKTRSKADKHCQKPLLGILHAAPCPPAMPSLLSALGGFSRDSHLGGTAHQPAIPARCGSKGRALQNLPKPWFLSVSLSEMRQAQAPHVAGLVSWHEQSLGSPLLQIVWRACLHGQRSGLRNSAGIELPQGIRTSRGHWRHRTPQKRVRTRRSRNVLDRHRRIDSRHWTSNRPKHVRRRRNDSFRQVRHHISSCTVP